MNLSVNIKKKLRDDLPFQWHLFIDKLFLCMPKESNKKKGPLAGATPQKHPVSVRRRSSSVTTGFFSHQYF